MLERHHQQRRAPARGAERCPAARSAEQARRRQLVRRDAPDRRDCRAMRRIVDLAIARKLVGFLPVLAAALAVALAGQAAVAAIAAFPPCPARATRLMKASTLSTPWLCCSGAARR